MEVAFQQIPEWEPGFGNSYFSDTCVAEYDVGFLLG